MNEIGSERGADRVAGGALLGTALLVVLAMAHHPTGGHGGGGLNGFIHGTMILLVAAWAFGFTHFALRRGLGRPAVLAGLTAYGISLVAHVGAATINGFAAPALAAHERADHGLFLLAWELNQALAKLGVFATGAAFALWSVDFLGRPGSEAKTIGGSGLLAGAVPAILLAGGWITMNVGGAFIVYAVHAAWAALVGLYMIRGKLGA